MVTNQGTFPPDEPEDTGPVSDHAEADEPDGNLHPYSVEFLKAFGIHDIPATSKEHALAQAAAWMYREGRIEVFLQDEPENVVLYLESIAKNAGV